MFSTILDNKIDAVCALAKAGKAKELQAYLQANNVNLKQVNIFGKTVFEYLQKYNDNFVIDFKKDLNHLAVIAILLHYGAPQLKNDDVMTKRMQRARERCNAVGIAGLAVMCGKTQLKSFDDEIANNLLQTFNDPAKYHLEEKPQTQQAVAKQEEQKGMEQLNQWGVGSINGALAGLAVVGAPNGVLTGALAGGAIELLTTKYENKWRAPRLTANLIVTSALMGCAALNEIYNGSKETKAVIAQALLTCVMDLGMIVYNNRHRLWTSKPSNSETKAEEKPYIPVARYY
jgi:hypothetical protein